MREPRQTEQPEDVRTPGESYQGIFNRIGRSLVAGVVATGVLWVLKLTRGSIPQLDTIRFLDRVAEATSKATGLPDTLTTGWIWHWVIGTLLWATLFGIMQPILPGRTFWIKGVAFGVITGLLTMLLVMRFPLCKLPVLLIPLLWMLSPQADENAPWGRASLQAIAYAPHKVVYDVAAPDVRCFSRTLDRVSHLDNLYHADHIYGLQAFKEHAGDPPVRARRLALGYMGGTAASQNEEARRRLAEILPDISTAWRNNPCHLKVITNPWTVLTKPHGTCTGRLPR